MNTIVVVTNFEPKIKYVKMRVFFHTDENKKSFLKRAVFLPQR